MVSFDQDALADFEPEPEADPRLARLAPPVEPAPEPPPGAAALNLLFGLLATIESTYPTHRTVVLRNPGGCAAGVLQSHEGGLCLAATPWERNSLAETLRTVLELSPQRATALARRAIRPGAVPFEALADLPDVPADVLRQIALGTTARECLRIAEACGPEFPGLLPLAAGVAVPRPFTALEVFMQAAAGLDDAPSDIAAAAYREFAPSADAALLLLRPSDERQLPVPIACKGFDRVALADVVPLCTAAAEMCRPPVFLRAGERPVLSTRRTDDADWVAAAGDKRLVLLRLRSRPDVARLLAQTVARLRKDAE